MADMTDQEKRSAKTCERIRNAKNGDIVTLWRCEDSPQTVQTYSMRFAPHPDGFVVEDHERRLLLNGEVCLGTASRRSDTGFASPLCDQLKLWDICPDGRPVIVRQGLLLRDGRESIGDLRGALPDDDPNWVVDWHIGAGGRLVIACTLRLSTASRAQRVIVTVNGRRVYRDVHTVPWPRFRACSNGVIMKVESSNLTFVDDDGSTSEIRRYDGYAWDVRPYSDLFVHTGGTVGPIIHHDSGTVVYVGIRNDWCASPDGIILRDRDTFYLVAHRTTHRFDYALIT